MKVTKGKKKSFEFSKLFEPLNSNLAKLAHP